MPLDESEIRTQLALLVERLANLADVVERHYEQGQKDRAELARVVDKLDREVTQYKGMFGGVMFVFSCLVAAITLAKGWLFNR